MNHVCRRYEQQKYMKGTGKANGEKGGDGGDTSGSARVL